MRSLQSKQKKLKNCVNKSEKRQILTWALTQPLVHFHNYFFYPTMVKKKRNKRIHTQAVLGFPRSARLTVFVFHLDVNSTYPLVSSLSAHDPFQITDEREHQTGFKHEVCGHVNLKLSMHLKRNATKENNERSSGVPFSIRSETSQQETSVNDYFLNHTNVMQCSQTCSI